MSKADVRWIQRFQNYRQALRRLTEAVELAEKRPLSELETQGLIRCFEYAHEFAWNVLKDYLEAQGFVGIIGARGATHEAFKNGLISNGEAWIDMWMDMIKARNLTLRTYKTEVAETIAKNILVRFHPALVSMERRFVDLEKRESSGE